MEQTVEELVADVFRRACTSREALEHVTGNREHSEESP